MKIKISILEIGVELDSINGQRMKYFKCGKFCGINVKIHQHLLFQSIFFYYSTNFFRYVRELALNGFKVSDMWVSQVFKQWHWSFKKASYQQLQKYTLANIEYYKIFLEAIQNIPWIRLCIQQRLFIMNYQIYAIMLELVCNFSLLIPLNLTLVNWYSH